MSTAVVVRRPPQMSLHPRDYRPPAPPAAWRISAGATLGPAAALHADGRRAFVADETTHGWATVDASAALIPVRQFDRQVVRVLASATGDPVLVDAQGRGFRGAGDDRWLPAERSLGPARDLDGARWRDGTDVVSRPARSLLQRARAATRYEVAVGRDGETRWAVAAPLPETCPLPEGVLIQPSPRAPLSLLDWADGRTLWTAAGPAPERSELARVGAHVWFPVTGPPSGSAFASVAVADGRVTAEVQVPGVASAYRAVDEAGRLYLTTGSHARVLDLAAGGAVVRRFDVRLPGPGGLPEGGGPVVCDDGSFFFADSAGAVWWVPPGDGPVVDAVAVARVPGRVLRLCGVAFGLLLLDDQRRLHAIAP